MWLTGKTDYFYPKTNVLNTKLQRHFDQLEADRKELLDQLTGVPVEKYHARPDARKWSISQILTHIFVSERLSLAYMKKKSLGIETLENSGPIEAIKLYMLKISQRIPLKYRAPKAVVQNTPEPLALSELKEQWNSLRNDLRDFLETIEDKNIHKKIYRHPVGRFNVVQAVIFFREHFRHHLPQINRLLK